MANSLQRAMLIGNATSEVTDKRGRSPWTMSLGFGPFLLRPRGTLLRQRGQKKAGAIERNSTAPALFQRQRNY